MKGVSTLVVVILLLLITISLVGFVFIFFSRSTEGAAKQAGEQQDQLQQNLGKQVRIDNAAGALVTIRHTGTVDINKTTDLTVYVNDVTAAGTWSTPNSLLTPSSTATYTLTVACPSAADIKIVTPAGSVTNKCA